MKTTYTFERGECNVSVCNQERNSWVELYNVIEDRWFVFDMCRKKFKFFSL